MELLRDPDRNLVLACQRLESDEFEAAFEALYLRYRDRVYAIAYRVTGSGADAMDVTQEAFSLLFRKIEGFRFDSLFSTWLFRIVVNASIDFRRRERSRDRSLVRSSTFDSGERELEDPTVGPEGKAELRELEDHVQASILKLSPKLGAILALRYLEGMSYEELAATLDISMGTVKSRLARAHMAIEKVLKGTLAVFGVPEGEQATGGAG